MKVLILGSKGMLGQELVNVYADQEVIAWDREDCDLLDKDAARQKIVALHPALLINATAYNDVDKAEGEGQEMAQKMNADIPGYLATIACELDISFVHYGTDYVFDGMRGDYVESDEPRPASVYGQTKLDGEMAVLASGGKNYVIRLSRLFGLPASSSHGKRSFVDVMLDLSTKRDTLDVVNDEIGSPTYAPDLAKATRDIVESRSPGLYHVTNQGSCSWFEFAQEIFNQTGRQIKVSPVPASTFPRAAERPLNSSLRSEKGIQLRPWQEALGSYLKTIL